MGETDGMVSASTPGADILFSASRLAARSASRLLRPSPVPSSRSSSSTTVRNQGAWPITGATFAVIRKVQDKPEQAREILKFFSWAIKEGGKSATESNYVPLPDSTAKAVTALWQVVRDGAGKPLYE